ncbi:hypothetical protein Pelo_17116 [Pelomyxa schiedti]|nr:hypothetical protein Pelo_17116 [Pelomyxa schiedti]
MSDTKRKHRHRHHSDEETEERPEPVEEHDGHGGEEESTEETESHHHHKHHHKKHADGEEETATTTTTSAAAATPPEDPPKRKGKRHHEEESAAAPVDTTPKNHDEHTLEALVAKLNSDIGSGKTKHMQGFCQYCQEYSAALSKAAALGPADVEGLIKNLRSGTNVTLSLLSLNFVTRQQTTHTPLVEGDGLEVIVHLLNESTGEDAIQSVTSCTRVLSNLVQTQKGQTVLKKDISLCNTILHVFASHAHNMDIQQNCMNVMSVLVSSVEARALILEPAVISQVISTLGEFKTVQRTQEIGVWCIYSISIPEKGQRLLLDSEAINCVISALQAFPKLESLVARSMTALQQLTFQAAPNYLRTFHQIGGLSYVVTALKDFKTNAQIQARCCSIIANIGKDKNARTEMQDTGCIDLIIESLKAHETDHDVAEAAIVALSVLVTTDQAKQKFYELDGHIRVSDAMKRFSDSSRLQSLSQNLIKGTGSCSLM